MVNSSSPLRKKLNLVAATIALAIISYLLFSSADRRKTKPIDLKTSTAVRQFVTPATQPARSFTESEMTFSPGEQTRVRVYDEVSGRLKYQFEAKKWEPTSTTDFHVENALVQIYMPKGEITYISSDEAEVTLARKGKNRAEVNSGWLKKNVKIVVDRTTTAWREAHPALSDRSAHPDDLTYISLDEARFDLERAELIADGPVKVESVEARIDNVTGLTVQWNQVDGRIDVLRFAHGGLMALRRGGKMIDFALPGTERDAAPKRTLDDPVKTGRGQAAAFQVPKAQANRPLSADVVSAEEAATQIRLEGGAVAANTPRALNADSTSVNPASTPSGLREAEALASAVESIKTEARAAKAGELAEMIVREEADKKSKSRVHTYRAVFSNQVVVEQQDGAKTLGKLEADQLEVNFDFGKRQRELATGSDAEEKGPTSRPAGSKNAAPSSGPFEAPAVGPESPAAAPDQTKLVLTWNGPLELRPLWVEPSQQTGQRFDAVATGKIVKLQSERGGGTCKQLVYRHERRQAWLSGQADTPVELVLDGAKKLVGKEVFFDQSRGLARVEGPGKMLDDNKDAPTRKNGDRFPATPARRRDVQPNPTEMEPAKSAVRKERDPVEITWTRGVDIELGSRPVERVNPTTGAKETKQKEFLRRAWFHGDVAMKQANERLTAEEVGVTFAAPSSAEQIAEHIQHLNMTGRVRMERDEDLMLADRLDVAMTVTSDGRSIPRIVDAVGDVLAQQGRRLIRAESMHVTMGLVAGKPRTVVKGDVIVQESKSHVGVETLDAQGRVFVHDPDSNLKIRDAHVLKSVIKDGSQLVHATIDSRDADTIAKVRAGDTAIHGRHIEIDVPTESIDVPGPGKAWMITQQDFGGRKLKRPEPVKMTWTDQMHLRGAKNYGVFTGQVGCNSEAFSLACEKLTVRLANAPQQSRPQREALLDHFWLTKWMAAMKPGAPKSAQITAISPRKRPTYVVAEDNAEALSSTYAPNSSDGQRGRLLSRMQIAGRQIVADLERQHMSVPCQGTLLIEDYQFDTKGRKPGPSGAGPRSGPLMSSAQGEGPSQTLVTWAASMDYYVDQNLVAFDKDVTMRHRSGQQIVLRDELAAGMGLDTSQIKRMKSGRLAELTGGYLLLEFRTSQGKDEKSGESRPMVRATDLERLIAKHAVHLQDGSKSLMGEYIQYLANADEVQVEGSPGVDARIIDQDEREQRMNMWRGPILIWNRKTNRIEAPQAAISARRR